MTKNKLIKDLESQIEKLDKHLPESDSTLNLLNKCAVILINDTEQIFNGIINQDIIRKSTELEKTEQDFLIFMLETFTYSELNIMSDPIHNMEEGIIDSNGPQPKEITIMGPNKDLIAHFDYYSGISYTRTKNYQQTTAMSKVREGNHFIVMCGDVLVKVNEDEFPNVPKRNL